MPLYEYAHISSEATECPERFEVLQSMQAEPLTVCPDCGRPCERVFSAPAAPQSKGGILSKGNLEAKGFTQYKKAGDGVYEKTAGKGPDVIHRD